LLKFSTDARVIDGSPAALFANFYIGHASSGTKWQYQWYWGPSDPLTSADGWTNFTVTVDTTWSDATALANGWTQGGGSASWASTWADVSGFATDFELAGGGVTTAGIDNYGYSEAPEPSSVALLAVGALALRSLRRRNG
jgi:hypothetical protein